MAGRPSHRGLDSIPADTSPLVDSAINPPPCEKEGRHDLPADQRPVLEPNDLLVDDW